MTQEELLVSPETFKTLEMLLQNFMEGSVRVSIPNAKSQDDYFGFKHGNHALIVKKKQTIQKGDWYIHTEPGQEKMIFIVVDPEKSICSGWDAKGKFFSKEWIFIGSRYQLIEDYKVQGILAENGYDFLTLKQSYLSDQYDFEGTSKTIMPIVDLSDGIDLTEG